MLAVAWLFLISRKDSCGLFMKTYYCV